MTLKTRYLPPYLLLCLLTLLLLGLQGCSADFASAPADGGEATPGAPSEGGGDG